MSLSHAPIDFIAYDPEGQIVLLAEAKNRHGTSDSWAAKLRRNMLAHGVLPKSQFFVIATPERIYGWKQDNSSPMDMLPQFTVDATRALQPYYARLNQKSVDISPRAFELLILTWLTDIARSTLDQPEIDPSLASLAESGLLSSLQKAEIEMNPAK